MTKSEEFDMIKLLTYLEMRSRFIFEELLTTPRSEFYEAGKYDEIPYCANCNLEVGEGGRVDIEFPERDDYNRCRYCVGK